MFNDFQAVECRVQGFEPIEGVRGLALGIVYGFGFLAGRLISENDFFNDRSQYKRITTSLASSYESPSCSPTAGGRLRVHDCWHHGGSSRGLESQTLMHTFHPEPQVPVECYILRPGTLRLQTL